MMKNKSTFLSLITTQLFSLILIVSLSSCTSIKLGLYGAKIPVRDCSEAELHKKSLKLKIEPEESYFIQPEYITYLDSLAPLYGFDLKVCGTNDLFKNHFQPLQILFFDRRGKLVSYNVNCYAGGFPNLKWNRNGELDTLPAKQVITPDTLISFNKLISFTKNIDRQKPYAEEFAGKDFKIVVFWTTFMGRQSKRLIHIIKKKYNKDIYKNVDILFVNADCLY